MAACGLQPLLGTARCRVVSPPGPVGPFAPWRIDDPCNMAAGGSYEPHIASKQLRDAPSSVPGNDVIFLRTHRIGILTNAAEINHLALERDLARFDEVVLDIGVAEIPAMGRACHPGA